MVIYYDNFEIKTLPKPPEGINQGSPAPLPELVQTATTTVLDIGKAGVFYGWWLFALDALAAEQGQPQIYGNLVKAVGKGITNFASPPWKAALAVMRGSAFNEYQKIFSKKIRLDAKAYWKQIYGNYNQGAKSNFGLSVTEGLTTTDSQTSQWSLSIGLSATVNFGFVSATLSTDFSIGGSTTHTISVNKATTQMESWTLPANSYVQIWQLILGFEAAGDPSKVIEMAVPRFQALTYPHDALMFSDAVTQEEVNSIERGT
jgi:hypothetical protein